MANRRWTATLGLVALVGCSRHAQPIMPDAKPGASERVAAKVKDVERMELFAIDPFSRQGATPATSRADVDRFYGYQVLARATVDDRAATRRLADSIAAAVSDPPDGVATGCMFVPRHGVRFTLAGGATVDFVVCFTCGDAEMMSGGRFSDGFWIDRGAAADFDALFAKHGVAVSSAD